MSEVSLRFIKVLIAIIMNDKPRIRPEWIPSAYTEGPNKLVEKESLQRHTVKPIVRHAIKGKKKG